MVRLILPWQKMPMLAAGCLVLLLGGCATPWPDDRERVAGSRMTTPQMAAIEREARMRGTRVYWVNPDKPRGWILVEQVEDEDEDDKQ